MNIKLKDITVGKIQLSKTQLPKIEQQLFKIDSIVKDQVVQSLQPIRAIALEYINKMNLLLENFKKLITKYQSQLQVLHHIKNGLVEAENYANIRNLPPDTEDVLKLQKDLVIATDNFTIKLFEILGKKLELVYVYQSQAANVVEIYKINSIEDLLMIRDTSKGNIETRLKGTKKILSTKAQLIKKNEYNGGIQQAHLLDMTYREIIRRYIKYRYPHKEGFASLVLWNMMSNPKWHGMWLFQRGDLSQAYTNYAIGRHTLNLIGNTNIPPETDIETFMSLVTQVDSTFGGVQGDIQDEEKRLEIAVKSLSATPQGILDTLKLAKDLLTRDITKDNFQKYKEEWKKQGRNTILKITGDTIEEALKEALTK